MKYIKKIMNQAIGAQPNPVASWLEIAVEEEHDVPFPGCRRV